MMINSEDNTQYGNGELVFLVTRPGQAIVSTEADQLWHCLSVKVSSQCQCDATECHKSLGFGPVAAVSRTDYFCKEM